MRPEISNLVRFVDALPEIFLKLNFTVDLGTPYILDCRTTSSSNITLTFGDLPRTFSFWPTITEKNGGVEESASKYNAFEVSMSIHLTGL